MFIDSVMSMHEAQLLAYIRVQTSDLEANVLFGLHGAKETF